MAPSSSLSEESLAQYPPDYMSDDNFSVRSFSDCESNTEEGLQNQNGARSWTGSFSQAETLISFSSASTCDRIEEFCTHLNIPEIRSSVQGENLGEIIYASDTQSIPSPNHPGLRRMASCRPIGSISNIHTSEQKSRMQDMHCTADNHSIFRKKMKPIGLFQDSQPLDNASFANSDTEIWQEHLAVEEIERASEMQGSGFNYHRRRITEQETIIKSQKSELKYHRGNVDVYQSKLGLLEVDLENHKNALKEQIYQVQEHRKELRTQASKIQQQESVVRCQETALLNQGSKLDFLERLLANERWVGEEARRVLEDVKATRQEDMEANKREIHLYRVSLQADLADEREHHAKEVEDIKHEAAKSLEELGKIKDAQHEEALASAKNFYENQLRTERQVHAEFVEEVNSQMHDADGVRTSGVGISQRRSNLTDGQPVESRDHVTQLVDQVNKLRDEWKNLPQFERFLLDRDLAADLPYAVVTTEIIIETLLSNPVAQMLIGQLQHKPGKETHSRRDIWDRAGRVEAKLFGEGHGGFHDEIMAFKHQINTQPPRPGADGVRNPKNMPPIVSGRE